MGVKLLVICGLALLMTIPAFFVNDLVRERTQRATEVTNEIGGHVGGRQTFLGPTLAIPYTVPRRSASEAATRGTYLVFPEQASANIETKTTERSRSLFKVPVFQADLKLQSSFNLKGVPADAPADAVLDWPRAELFLGVSDARGALADATLMTGSETVTLLPSKLSDSLSFGCGDKGRARMALLGVMLPGIAKPNATFDVFAKMRFSGAERVAVLAYGRTTHVKAEGDWRSPGFDGATLPVNRNVSNNGFQAEWSVPFIARGVPAEGPSESVCGLSATALGVSFIKMADPYQSVERALKYVLLIICLVFLSYFVFEVMAGKRLHPAQYVLVGAAQIIFYILLLSIAERTGFGPGFLLAAGATVGLLAANASWVFESRREGVRAVVVFSLLYGLIYVLLRLEDYALLVGAISSFVVISAVMYFTRDLDWYASMSIPGTAKPQTLGEV